MEPMCVVEWVDSALQNVQVGRNDYPEPELIRSVGWVVEEDENKIILARDDHKDDEYRGLLAIPTECVRRRWAVSTTDDCLQSSPDSGSEPSGVSGGSQ